MSSVTPGKLVTPDTSTFTNANNIATTTTGSNGSKYLDNNIKITKANSDGSLATITNTKINGETVSLLDGEKIVGLSNLNFTPITTEDTSLPETIKLTETNLPTNVAYINQNDNFLDSSVRVNADQIVPQLIVSNEDEGSNGTFPNQLSGNILVNVNQISGFPDISSLNTDVANLKTATTGVTYAEGVTSVDGVAVKSAIESKVDQSAYNTKIGELTELINSKEGQVVVTADKALISDAEGKIAASSVSSTELGYLAGVTSSVQAQINAAIESKVDQSAYNTKIGELTELINSKEGQVVVTADKALISDAEGKIAASSVSSTELGYLAGVTSSVQAQINAANAAVVTAKAEADLKISIATQALQLFKSNSGALHCGATSWFGKSSTTAQSTANITKSVLFRIVDYDWRKHSTNSSITTLAQVGGYGGHNGFMLDYRGTSFKMFSSFYNNGNDYKLYVLFEVYYNNFSQFLKNSVNDFCVVFKTDANSIIVDARLYLNGNLISSVANTGVAWYQNLDAFRFNGANVEAFTYKDVCVFNFDVSDATAPYTLADYQQGKPIPVECLDTSAEQRALLALENYTITNGTTKQIFDYSGNANDATCSGSVKGDNDNRVQRLVDFIKA